MTRALLACLLALLVAAPAAGAADWHVAQPPGPDPGGPPVGLGAVGDIAFWTTNRGMLITSGNDAIAPGLFAYDGSSWYRYSTVCGGRDGRIAWAGPNEFWTVSDQRAGQQTTTGDAQQLEHRSLCHFRDGQVVASYAEPLGSANEYEPINAAACAAPDDCWFGGDKLPGSTNSGAFHLHWDGKDLTAIPSLSQLQPDLGDPARAVASMAHHRGRWYESVTVAADDDVPGESQEQPFVLHAIDLESSSPFTPLFTEEPLDRGGAAPSDLSALLLSSDGSQLWAVGGDAGEGKAGLVAVRRGDDGSLRQIPLRAPAGTFAVGDRVTGVAALPGSDSAWIGYATGADGGDAPARLARVAADGTLRATATLPVSSDAIGRKGPAGPVACPAADQCWTATATGWLFHLGSNPARDGDPLLHSLVTFRPADDSVPQQAPDDLPEDTSGADAGSDQVTVAQPATQTQAPAAVTKTKTKRAKALVTRVRSRLVHGTTLALSFTLRRRAHFRLLALRKTRTVAKTKRYTLKAGRHTVHLRLNRRRYPTKLKIDVSEIGAKPSTGSDGGDDDTGSGTDSTGAPIAVTTRVAAPAGR